MSTTRRQFIQTGVGLGAIAGAAAALQLSAVDATHGGDPAGRSAVQALALERVVYDERFAHARSFADEAARQGARSSAIRGSVHDLWYDDLYHHWRTNKAAVAGMTDFRALFLLEMMASDAGLRVVHRMHHITRPDGGGLSHEVFGPLAARAEFTRRIDSAGQAWDREAARIATSWPRELAASGLPSNLADSHDRALDGTALVSWIIAAPKSRSS